jgi:uncharacterized protein (DUF1501 family)
MRAVDTNNAANAAELRTAWNVIDDSVVSIAEINASYQSSVVYQSDPLSKRFKDAAKLIQYGTDPGIIAIRQIGYDTHSGQANMLHTLFTELNNALASFLQDLQAMGRSEDVLILIESEFGRTTQENATQGCDHGHGSVQIVIGPAVQSGIHGAAYKEADFNNKYLPGVIDFRELRAQVLERFLQVDPALVFPESFAKAGVQVIA